MEITPLWQKFKQLSTLDKQLLTLHDEHNQIVKNSPLLEKKIIQQESAFASVEANLKKQTHAVTIYEAEISELDSKINAKNKQLEHITNSKQQQRRWFAKFSTRSSRQVAF